MSRMPVEFAKDELPFEGEHPVPIAHLHARQVAQVKLIEADDDDTARLKALGICQGRRVQLVQSGDPLIVKVLGARIGVSARLAANVIVEPCCRKC
ncbi:FeoA family protein [Poriferisphaera sp. WC338]|uniref:FeoA family protein n=1 Tax=Poriferisphaera sp. WC338 TaxID=3425129 RepID=UPI003D813748